VTLLERLSALAESADPNGSVTVSVAWLREQLAAERCSSAPTARQATTDIDLTVPEVATLFKRAKSTIRTWIAAGEFPNAYRFHDREWRIPQSDVNALQQRQREARSSKITRRQAEKRGDLGSGGLAAWRNYVRRA